MTASISLRAYYGSGAGTESAALAGVTLISEDAVTGAPVAPGSVSYERWLRLRVDAAPAVGIANLWVTNTGPLPDGVSFLFGVTDTPATPVNTVSAVAKKDLTSGQKFIFQTDPLVSAGSHSRYIVIQEVATLAAPSGAIPEQGLVFGWAEK